MSDWFTNKQHPNHWYNRASDLCASAGAVWLTIKGNGSSAAQQLGLGSGFDMDLACRPVYHMLCGLALEVILKAVLANRGEDVPPSHRLNHLADLVGVERTDEERRLFDYYSDSIVWSSRYPMPKAPTPEKLEAFYARANQVLTVKRPASPGSKMMLSVWADSDRWEVFHGLWTRISVLFQFR